MNACHQHHPRGWLLRTLPLLGVMAAIFALSHMPGNSLYLPRFPGADKLAHGTAYGALSAAAIFASVPLSQRLPKMLYCSGVIAFCLVYGISDEFHQSFIPGRMVSGLDVLADTVGAAMVVLAWNWFKAGTGTERC